MSATGATRPSPAERERIAERLFNAVFTPLVQRGYLVTRSVEQDLRRHSLNAADRLIELQQTDEATIRQAENSMRRLAQEIIGEATARQAREIQDSILGDALRSFCPVFPIC